MKFFLIFAVAAALCVSARATMTQAEIIENVFYDEEITERGTLDDLETGGTGPSPGTPEQKMTQICTNLQQSENSPMLRMIVAQLRALSPEIRAKVSLAMRTKKNEMIACCQLAGSERLDCMADARSARFNRVCNDGEPFAIWATLKGHTADTTSVVERCCALQGAARNNCFLTMRSAYIRSRLNRQRT